MTPFGFLFLSSLTMITDYTFISTKWNLDGEG